MYNTEAPSCVTKKRKNRVFAGFSFTRYQASVDNFIITSSNSFEYTSVEDRTGDVYKGLKTTTNGHQWRAKLPYGWKANADFNPAHKCSTDRETHGCYCSLLYGLKMADLMLFCVGSSKHKWKSEVFAYDSDDVAEGRRRWNVWHLMFISSASRLHPSNGDVKWGLHCSVWELMYSKHAVNTHGLYLRRIELVCARLNGLFVPRKMISV